VDEVLEEGSDGVDLGWGGVVVVVVGGAVTQGVIIDGMLLRFDFPASEYPHFSLGPTTTVDESVEPGLPIIGCNGRIFFCCRVQFQVRVQVRAVQETSELQSTVQRQSGLEVRRLAKVLQHF